jgi:hypothetical protein
VGFENELIGQSNFPHQPSLARYAAIAIFPNRQVLLRRLGNRPGPPPPGANMPSTPCLVQGGKLGMRGVAWSRGLAISRIAQGPYEMGCATASVALLGDPGKSSLTVFRRNLCAFSRFHQKFPPGVDGLVFCILCIWNGLQRWNLKAPTRRSSNRSSSGTS